MERQNGSGLRTGLSAGDGSILMTEHSSGIGKSISVAGRAYTPAFYGSGDGKKPWIARHYDFLFSIDTRLSGQGRGGAAEHT